MSAPITVETARALTRKAREDKTRINAFMTGAEIAIKTAAENRQSGVSRPAGNLHEDEIDEVVAILRHRGFTVNSTISGGPNEP